MGRCHAPSASVTSSHHGSIASGPRPRLSDVSVYAGTVPCPECNGCPVIQRHTPNLERFFGLEDPWQFKARPPVLSLPVS